MWITTEDRKHDVELTGATIMLVTPHAISEYDNPGGCTLIADKDGKRYTLFRGTLSECKLIRYKLRQMLNTYFVYRNEDSVLLMPFPQTKDDA